MIAQIIIALFGVTAVWLSQDENEERRKYACIFGLLGQPAWVWAAWSAEQWGILALCVLYTWCWLRGFRQYWMDGRGIRFRPKRHATPQEIDAIVRQMTATDVPDTPLLRKLQRETIVQESIDRINELHRMTKK